MTQRLAIVGLVAASLAASAAPAAELVTLSPSNYAAYAPSGLKAKAFLGDYVLRNDKVVAVVADPMLQIGRSGGRNVYPSPHARIIDFALRDGPNDLLQLFDPACSGPQLRPVGVPRPDNGAAASKQEEFRDEARTYLEPGRGPTNAPRVTLRLALQEPALEVRYILEDGWAYVMAEVDYKAAKGGLAALEPGALLQMSPRPLRGDDRLVWTLTPGGTLAWMYDPWGGQAYAVQPVDGILAVEPGPIREAGLWLRLKPTAPAASPGPVVTARYRLFAGRHAFDAVAAAEEAAGRPVAPLRLEVTAPDGPVAEADVTALRDGARIAAGRTGPDGVLSARLPAGSYELRVEPRGRPAVKVAFDTAGGGTVRAACEAAGRVAAAVTTPDDRPLPCQVRFAGRNGTPAPRLGPVSGDRLAGDTIYTETGAFLEILPPGDYTAIVSRGPEYSMATVDLTVRRGATAELKATLERVVPTPGWITAHFANTTAASGQSSDMSPAGRVLALLAEGIEVAPSTDAETITDLAPTVRGLRAAAWIATCPGVRLNWPGGKYAQRAHTSFPLVARPGAQDGGMLQRPQHVMTRSWLERWNPAGRKAIIIDEPWSERVFLRDLDGDGEPDMLVGAGNDILDVHDLRPVFGPVPEGQDRRVLDWLAALRLGYRMKGVVSSPDPFGGRGRSRWRTYVRCASDDPAAVRVEDIVESMDKGRMVMTSGPFIDVALRAAGSSGTAGPGDQLASPDGRVEAAVSVLAPDWIRLDEVRLLVNGRPDPALTFARAAAPDRFGAPPRAFTAVVPLVLTNDAFVVVAASGADIGPGAGPDNASARDARVAVANPVWVDVGGKGYRPSPPVFGLWRVILGGDENVGRMWEVRPIPGVPGAAPGLVQMPIRNRTDETVRGTLSFTARPAGAVRFHGGESHTFRTKEARYQAKPAEVDAVRMVNNRLDYTLEPKQTLVAEFEVSLAEGANPGGFFLSVPRDEDRGISMVGYYFEVAGYTCPVSRVAVPLEKVAEALSLQRPYVAAAADGARLGEVRFGVAGDKLAIDARVAAAPGPGARIRVFTNGQDKEVAEPFDPMFRIPPKVEVVESVLEPAGEGRTTKGHVLAKPAVAVKAASGPDGDGYRLQALLPLKELGIAGAASGGRFLIEFQIEAPDAAGPARAATVFGSTSPATDNTMFGSINGVQTRVGHY